MSLIEKMKKNKKFKDVLVENVVHKNIDEFYHAGSITLNLLLSGKVNGGVPKGKLTMFAAPKAHSKTIIAMIAAANAQKKGCQVIWLDSEFAYDSTTAKMFGLDSSDDKFLLVQDSSIEVFQSFIVNLTNDYDEKTDGKVMIVVDSLGNMISSKTIEDSLDGKDTRDMSEAQKKNKFSKMLLRLAGIHNIPVILIAHLYEDMKQYSTGAISGGSSSAYAASSILKITSKAKEKDGDAILGNSFTAYTDKGRLAREHSKLKFMASYDSGINMFYGLLDDALQGGYVTKPSVGWYSRPAINDKKYREADIYNKDFWKPVFENTDFKQYLETKYSYIDYMNEEFKEYDTSYQLDEIDNIDCNKNK